MNIHAISEFMEHIAPHDIIRQIHYPKHLPYRLSKLRSMSMVIYCFCCELLAWPLGAPAVYNVSHISKIEHSIHVLGVTLDAYPGYVLRMAERGGYKAVLVLNGMFETLTSNNVVTRLICVALSCVLRCGISMYKSLR